MGLKLPLCTKIYDDKDDIDKVTNDNICNFDVNDNDVDNILCINNSWQISKNGNNYTTPYCF